MALKLEVSRISGRPPTVQPVIPAGRHQSPDGGAELSM